MLERMIRSTVRDAAAWLDGVIAADLAALHAAASGIEHHPRVAAMLRQRRARLTAWRAEKLDELHAEMLRAINRLH
jgi:hypothetical protein